MSFRLSSPDFIDGGHIPALYTCEGDDISPPLAWSGAPEGTKSFVLLCDDPDAPAGTWHHWAIFDIPASVDHLDKAYPATGGLYPQGVNDFGNPCYGGPCPPPGHGIHHYRFRLLALNVPSLALPKQVMCAGVEKAAHLYALSKAEMTGVYSRR
jgi:Raf kinase inhibitor-like YbhB/YbcL family protein